MVITCVICGGLPILAIWAWFTHFDWLRNGNYSRTSLPMSKVASDLTMLGVVSFMVAWGIWRWVQAREARKPTNR
jgi:hypothetical protein